MEPEKWRLEGDRLVESALLPMSASSFAKHYIHYDFCHHLFHYPSYSSIVHIPIKHISSHRLAMAKELSSAEEAPAKRPNSFYDKWKSRILLGLSVTGISALVISVLGGLWWAQQTNVDALQKQINSLQEIQKSGKLTFQQSLELQKDIAGLEKDRITLSNNVYGTLVQAAGGAALLIGLYFTWQNQKVAEKTAANNFKSTQETLRLSQEGQITERFTRTIDQLGSEKIEVRLGGIYALERIAKDSPKDHWTIMEVLTSFVQEKSPL